MISKKADTPAREIAQTLDRLVVEAERSERVSFVALVRAAGLDPKSDFVGAFLADLDFRDEDLRDFNFSGADLTGADFRRANVVGVHFEDAILTGAIGLPTGVQTRQELPPEENRKMARARSSGLRLSEAQASLVKGMLLRGDRQHDIAAWFGVNSGRIAGVKDGKLHPTAPSAQLNELPPPGSPGQFALTAMSALANASRALEDPKSIQRAKQIIDAALSEINQAKQ
jgi:uncharacterized protein YjbI with pentapeptide repeats